MNRALEIFNQLKVDYEMDEDAADVMELEELLHALDKPDGPIITEAGKMIVGCLQQQSDINAAMTAKEIAEYLQISSRKISGAMRKLMTDGFTKSNGGSPASYCLTEKGKTFELN